MHLLGVRDVGCYNYWAVIRLFAVVHNHGTYKIRAILYSLYAF